MALSDDEKKRLEVVIEVAGDDETQIRYGIIRALRDVNERGTRNYLWHLLDMKARAKIRRTRRKLLPENFRLTS